MLKTLLRYNIPYLDSKFPSIVRYLYITKFLKSQKNRAVVDFQKYYTHFYHTHLLNTTKTFNY